MQCPRCRAENRQGRRFCAECGAPLSIVCPACGFSNEPEEKFCGGCGQALGAAVPEQFASPRVYTPKHLAEKILTSRSAIEGERKQVTVLFVDVSGFTALSERLDPEEVHRLINRAFELMLEEVHRYEGTVNQFLGDGIMALFGAPIAHEDHAQRAIHAALGIQRALEQYRDELQPRGIDFIVRQGLNTGPVVVGSIGTDLRMDYTAVGDTTNVAARLQQGAAPGRIVVSEATHRLAGGYFHTRPLGEIAVKGKAEPVKAWEVITARAPRTRLELEAERGLTPFVGREHELETLLGCFERVRAGHGQIVFLVGEAGIGKSRLLHEFRRRLGDEATWLEGHAISFGQSIAFHPLTDLLRRTFRIEEGDAEATIAEKVERSVVRLGEDLRPILPYLRFLLSVDPGDAAVARQDPRQRRAAIFDAVTRLTLRACEVRPQVVVFEDGHWMDKATEEYLLFMADSVPAGRLLFVLTYRPGYSQPFGERTYHTRLALDSLAPEASIRLAEGMLATEGLPDELRSLIARKAEGNPFFVEEVVKSLQEIGALRPAGAGYVLAQRLDERAVPDTIQDVIMARIDRLPEEAKKTLQLASVIGREFTRRLLERIAGVRDQTEAFLQELKALELIHEKRMFPELAYMFKHALTHEVAYGSLLVQRRKDLHRLIGLAIEDLYADRLAEQYEILAYHFAKAEDAARARDYHIKAGDKAAAAFANREALAHYEHALGQLEPGDLARQAAVRAKAAPVVAALGDPDRSLRVGEEALVLYERLGDRQGRFSMHMHIQMLYTGGGYWDGAREDMAVKHLEAAAAIVESGQDSLEKGLVYQRTAHLYLHREQPQTTLIWARRALDLFNRMGITTMGTSLGTALIYTGEFDEGIAYNVGNWAGVVKAGNAPIIAILGHELTLAPALIRDLPRAREWGERTLAEVTRATRGSRLYEAFVGRPLLIAHTLAGETAEADRVCRFIEEAEATQLFACFYQDAAAVGFHYLRRGDWEKARDYLERRLADFRSRNNLAAVLGCALVLGNLEAEVGNHGRAHDLLTPSLESCQKGGDVLLELWVLPALAELHLATGQPARATECIQRGFELMTSDRSWYGLPAPLHVVRGMLATSEGDWDAAASAFGEAAAINRRHGLPWDEAKALYEWGRMLLARGGASAREAGRLKLDQALDVFRRVEARKEVEKTLAARAHAG